MKIIKIKLVVLFAWVVLQHNIVLFAATDKKQMVFLDAAQACDMLTMKSMYHKDPDVLDYIGEHWETALHCLTQKVDSWQDFQSFYSVFAEHWYKNGHFIHQDLFGMVPAQCLLEHYWDEIPQPIRNRLCATLESLDAIPEATQKDFFQALSDLDHVAITFWLNKHPQLLHARDDEGQTPLYYFASLCACWQQFEPYYKRYGRQWWKNGHFFKRDQRNHTPLHYLFLNCKAGLPKRFAKGIAKHCPSRFACIEMLDILERTDLEVVTRQLQKLYRHEKVHRYEVEPNP